MIASFDTLFEAAGEQATATAWSGTWAWLPDSDWTRATEGGPLLARSWRTLLNDPHCQALAFTLKSQILGDGLWWRSAYGSASEKADQQLRRSINTWVAGGRVGTLFDAGNWLTADDIETQTLLAGFFGGDGWQIRAWSPSRPGADRALCWRPIDASRVETPPDKAGASDIANGIRYRNGMPWSIFVRRSDPAQSAAGRLPKLVYDEIRIYDEDGHRQVVHFAPMRWRAGQDLGVPALASGLLLIHQLRELLKAHVTGKRIQASHPIIVEATNPQEAAKKYKEMVEAGQASADASVLFVPKGGSTTFSQAIYQGSDLSAVSEVYLRGMCASLGYPWQWVLAQLTNAGLASAQAAIDQVERTTGIWQRTWIQQVLVHVDGASIREGWGRGVFGAIPWSPALLAGEWQRPRRSDANRLRSRQAAVLAKQLGFSLSTIHDDLGSDYEQEQERLAEDRQTSKRTGNPFQGDPTVAGTNAGQVQPDPDPSADDPPGTQQQQANP
jgi:hypothetical protein